MPPCHVREKIPCDPMATQGFVSLFPLLASVKVPPLLTKAPIGLLLGYHVSSAFCPLQIAYKDIESPFGIYTHCLVCYGTNMEHFTLLHFQAKKTPPSFETFKNSHARQKDEKGRPGDSMTLTMLSLTV